MAGVSAKAPFNNSAAVTPRVPGSEPAKTNPQPVHHTAHPTIKVIPVA